MYDPNNSVETRLVTAGRDTQGQKGFVNPPIVRGSTVLFPTAEDIRNRNGQFQYGRQATPTTLALRSALQELEGPNCAGIQLTSSGLAAISTTLLALLRAGDHVLVCDNVYRPTRTLCETILRRFGIDVEYFDQSLGAAIERMFRDNTRAVVVEAPGSLSFEMPDVPAIASVAHNHGLYVIDDNTWATPLFHRSLEYGVDISIQAGTKYIGGHADTMFGVIAANARSWPMIEQAVAQLGCCVSPEDVYLVLRGLRTLNVRLRQHEYSALELAYWLRDRPEIVKVLHPALEDHPGHAIWKRDFTGSTGLFSVILRPMPDEAVNGMLNNLRLFGMGYSWGGFESLVLPFDCTSYRTVTKWAPGGPAVRIHVGLENVDDLKADLSRAFSILK